MILFIGLDVERYKRELIFSRQFAHEQPSRFKALIPYTDITATSTTYYMV